MEPNAAAACLIAGVALAVSDDTITAKNGNRTGQGSLKCRFSAVGGPAFDEEFGEEVFYSFDGDVWVKTT